MKNLEPITHEAWKALDDEQKKLYGPVMSALNSSGDYSLFHWPLIDGQEPTHEVTTVKVGKSGFWYNVNPLPVENKQPEPQQNEKRVDGEALNILKQNNVSVDILKYVHSRDGKEGNEIERIIRSMQMYCEVKYENNLKTAKEFLLNEVSSVHAWSENRLNATLRAMIKYRSYNVSTLQQQLSAKEKELQEARKAIALKNEVLKECYNKLKAANIIDQHSYEWLSKTLN